MNRLKKKYIEDYPDFYSNIECPHCGRTRVEEFLLDDHTSVHICEKCKWCIETNSYQDLEKQVEGVNDIKNCYVGYKRYIVVFEDE